MLQPNQKPARLSGNRGRPARTPRMESLEQRQYWYAPDMYVAIAGGGCMCGACAKCLGTPPVADAVQLQSAPLAPAVMTDPVVAPLDPAAVTTGFSAGINFQPQGTPVPAGFFPDYGDSIGTRSGGLTYGWSDNNQANARDRDNSRSPNQAFDTLNHMQKPGGSGLWGINVPNGSYNVRLVAGDAENFDSDYRMNVENTPALAGVPSANNPWIEGRVTVNVTDGRIEISNGAGAVNNKIAFLEITPAGQPPVDPAPAVTGALLINADTDLMIGALGPEQTLDLASFATRRLNIQITTSDGTGSVRMTYDGVSKVENFAPFSLAGDTNGDFAAWTPGVGSHTLVVTPFAGSGATGAAGTPVTIRLNIVDSNPPGSSPTVTDITWSQSGPRSPLPRTEAGVVQVGSKVYSIGGFTATGGSGTFFPVERRVHVYDMATRQWKQLATLPSAAPANHSGVASDGKFIYVVAGQLGDTYGIGTNTSWRYSISANTWEKFTNLPAVRFGGAAFIVNGWLHYVGGDKAGRKTPATDHWSLNLNQPGSDWARRAPMPLPGDHMSHASVNGKVYILGGEHGHQSTNPDEDATYVQHNYTLEYNPKTDSWIRKSDMPISSSHFEAGTLVINNKIVTIGGLLTGGDDNLTDTVRVYNPAADKWSVLPTRFPKRLLGNTVGYWNGKVYVTDGFSPDETDRQVGFEGTIQFG